MIMFCGFNMTNKVMVAKIISRKLPRFFCISSVSQRISKMIWNTRDRKKNATPGFENFCDNKTRYPSFLDHFAQKNDLSNQ
jgi:hypothetical protein